MEYHIVIVDDDSLSITYARDLLADENMKVSCLRSGKDLLKFLQKNTPDLILLDILMPEMDGFETYHAVRRFEEQEKKSQIPIIFLTGEKDTETERRGLKAGASDFIHKPFNKDVLVRRIYNTINNSKTIESLTEEATIDKLTGFLNKASGTKKGEKLCLEHTGALVICDIDSFKLINDLYGHDMGDKALMAFADVIRHNTRETDVVSRVGGDEFMAFFENIIGEKAITSLTDRLNAQFLAEAVKLMGEDLDIPLGISLGVVMVPEYGRDYETLFSLADSALYTVKENGKHGYAIYGLSDDVAEDEGEDLESELIRTTKIVSERNITDGALMLGREAFASAYRFAVRLCSKHKRTATLILFKLSLKNNDGSISIRDASSQFGEVLRRSLDKCDIVLKNKVNSYFIFVPETDENGAAKLTDKILTVWDASPNSGTVIVEHVIKNLDFSK
ncbi:MAG: diguanylate cyclase [Lachnospiraceae bacterium]|nr:diguanylate cyclase [Lachnospiraceae bacterium]